MKPEKPIQLDFSVAFQIKYSLVMMAGSMVTSLALYFYLDRELGEGYFESLVMLRKMEQALPFSLFITFVIQLILILAITTAINLFVSHKIGVPVYRYENALKKIIEGDLRFDVHTRDGYQLKSMLTSINGWQNSIREVYAAGRNLQEELDHILGQLSQGDQADLDSVLLQLDEVRRSMGDFCAIEEKETT